ncbi:hypothetical protein [Nitrobacter sp. JJSN]|uniref:hypothetical protein n=1 Tax=Nitrobacter sp. JJSN TaxID=3453033 RepID=UPI003F772644
MIGLLCFALAVLASPFKSKLRLEAENAALPLVAAAKTRRIGYGVELDPIYCDVILARLARVLKADPVLQQTGKTFTEMATERNDATAEWPEAAGGAQ